ncbi:tyrosine--tRNA ligase [Candidatus Parcubacteria bacterium]|nr:tyrosine--tRNA ligase [Candidatus Parcubacteria bacterium]
MNSSIDTSEENIRNILTRGVEDIVVKEHVESRLTSGEKLRVKLGIDPTGNTIHIGRAVVLRKLKAFQDLGHHIILIVGDFTAQIGDPSDKLEKRPMITRESIDENLKNYKKIIGKIIDVDKAEFVYNSEWLKKLGFQEISELAESFSVQQMIARRNFKERIDKGQEISLREFLYPLMQGYDSVAVEADVELGGFDQLFNLKAGRVIQKHFGQPEQDIVATAMLEGTDGRKMSTSWGNVINITDEPNDMYGKVMSLNDNLIIKYFLLCTDVKQEEIKTIEKELAGDANPRDLKMRLAREIVTLYHDKDAADKAQENFINTFAKGGVPDNVEIVKVKKGTLLADILIQKNIVPSKSEWRRLVEGHSASIMGTGKKIEDQFEKIEEPGVYKIGSRRFIKIEID